MTPAPGTAAAPLPPLPELSGAGSGPAMPQDGGMAAIMSGLIPIKQGVDAIQSACKAIVQSGMIPGSEQVCGQIIALATSLLPMAAQNAMQPAGGGMGMPGGGSVPGGF